VAVSLSLIHPGAGHYYLGDAKKATRLAVIGGLELGAALMTGLDGWPEKSGGWDELFDDPTFLLAYIYYNNTWMWSVFSAYRDARTLNGTELPGCPLPRQSFADLLFAPVNPRVVSRPEVALGLVGMLGVGALVSYAAEGALLSDAGWLFEREKVNFMGRHMHRGVGTALGELYYAALFAPVGIGEEAFFRGLLQTSWSEARGKARGWVTASLIFGLAHAPNALLLETREERVRYLTMGVPYLTLAGFYLGWVYMRNDFSLAESVALHFWYDFLISTLGFILDPDSAPFAAGIGVPIGRLR
jgi:membrane protease YdiL (CAAX protease family)